MSDLSKEPDSSSSFIPQSGVYPPKDMGRREFVSRVLGLGLVSLSGVVLISDGKALATSSSAGEKEFDASQEGCSTLCACGAVCHCDCSCTCSCGACSCPAFCNACSCAGDGLDLSAQVKLSEVQQTQKNQFNTDSQNYDSGRGGDAGGSFGATGSSDFTSARLLIRNSNIEAIEQIAFANLQTGVANSMKYA